MEENKKQWKKNLVFFLTGQSLSLFGSSVVQFAIIWYITLSTQSGIMMMISTVCAVVPQVIISLFAGVWADKYNKKLLIIIPDAVIAISTLILSILFAAGFDHISLLFLVMIIRSFGAGIQTPSVQAFIPNIVPKEQLMRANGINGTIQSIILILSPIASGALLGSISLGNILLVDCVTAVLGIGVMLQIKYHYKPNKNQKLDYKKEIWAGFSYIKNHSFISRIVGYISVLSFLITPVSILTPLLIARTFGVEPWRLTANEIVFFIGSVIGGILISTWGGFKNRLHTVGIGCILCGLFSCLMGFSSNFTFFLFTMGMIGVMAPIFNTPLIVTLQEIVEPDMHGRIFSFIQIISAGIMPISMVLYGPLSDIIQIEWILIIDGGLFLLISFLLMFDPKNKKYFSELLKKDCDTKS